MKQKLILKSILARVCGVPAGQCSGGQLTTMLVATNNDIIFFLFSFSFPVVYFSNRRSARIKKLM